jgi:two-component system, OmpR family, response regulator
VSVRSLPRRALVIDRSPADAEVAAEPLRAEGFVVDVVVGARTGFDAALTHVPDLIVLDTTLPNAQGTELIQRIRAAGVSAPIIVRSRLDAPATRIAGLEAGADDYLSRMVADREYTARVHNVMRRVGPPATGVLRFSDVVLNQVTHRVHRAGAEIELPPTQYRLLRYFMLNPNQVLSKETLLLQVWNSEWSPDYNLVEIAVGRLRRQLLRHGSALIQTLRYRGYVLREPD